jgi:hypothetical protein
MFHAVKRGCAGALRVIRRQKKPLLAVYDELTAT